MTAKERKAAILEKATALCVKHGSKNVTRRMVAEACKTSEALVSTYFGNAKDAQKIYARNVKKLGLMEPSAEKQKLLGEKLRSHAPKAKVVKVKPKKPFAKISAGLAEKPVDAKSAVIKKKYGLPKTTVNVVAKKAARLPKAPPLEIAPLAPPLPPLPLPL